MPPTSMDNDDLGLGLQSDGEDRVTEPLMENEPEASKIHLPVVKIPSPGSRERPPILKIGIFGGRGVGKTMLLRRIVLNQYLETYTPTPKDTFRKSWTVDNHTYIIELLDSTSDSKLRNQCIRECDGILLVYSIASLPSFHEAKETFELVRRVKKEQYEEWTRDKKWPESESLFQDGRKGWEEKGFRCIGLVGNCCEEGGNRVIAKVMGDMLAKEIGAAFGECSAKTGEGVWDVVDSIVRVIRHEKAEQVKADEAEAERREKEEARRKKSLEKMKRKRDSKAAKEEIKEEANEEGGKEDTKPKIGVKIWRKMSVIGRSRQSSDTTTSKNSGESNGSKNSESSNEVKSTGQQIKA